MKKNKFINLFKGRSIISILVIAIVLIFLFMIIILNFSFNIYQEYLSYKIGEKLISEIQSAYTQNNDGILFLLEDAQIRSTMEFRIYSILISLLVTFLGASIFYVVIIKVLKPLKQLSNTVSKIDLESLSSSNNEISIYSSSLEIQELSLAINNSFKKIFDSYEQQRDFSINIAHELRTPLAILLMKIDVFERQNIYLSDEMLDFISTVKSNVLRLSEMVDSIMLLKRNQVVNLQHFNLNDVINEVIFDLDEVASSKNITLNFNGPDVFIYSDDQLLERVIFNLIENAIKYNITDGKIDISIQDTIEKIIITISDTGIGISDNEKKHIFDLFYRVDDSRSRDFGGYGIGLALVKNILDYLGGTIEVKDNYPKGTTFNLYINKKSKFINAGLQ
ncbi:Signal transduction histidine kinase [Peptoniphilus asaccharolyticus DSM 20463]|uniref:histidine kinase n=1 Tax=Peptoniphilus asaccharolyticus DSM 20463 TaxID=573058 RepID=A0A1W1V2X6_PEPAS|nr:HAMP domain-containing sensor histidine kinase [Peptoniphilus asaccharolyticus]MBL7576167.1 sensor histidine kinase [Peptoniphilus asaccharolyticus]SMB87682.1 Signal transduction histidine kinase [Peptoniphilus asaccharolyticus DSM 20463]